jgi:hypothetical protein
MIAGITKARSDRHGPGIPSSLPDWSVRQAADSKTARADSWFMM